MNEVKYGLISQPQKSIKGIIIPLISTVSFDVKSRT